MPSYTGKRLARKLAYLRRKARYRLRLRGIAAREPTPTEMDAERRSAQKAFFLEALSYVKGEAPDTEVLARVYKPDATVPVKWYTLLRQDPVCDFIVNSHLRQLLKDRPGLGPEAVLKRIEEMPDRMRTDSGYIKSVQIQAHLAGIPTEPDRYVGGHAAQSPFAAGLEGYDGPASLPEHVEDADYEDIKDENDGTG